MQQICTILFLFTSFYVRHSYSYKNYGIFTLNFQRFTNPSRKLANGRCCHGEPDLSGCPDLPCKTAFLLSVRPNMGRAPWKSFNYGIIKTASYDDSENLTLNYTGVFEVKTVSWKKIFQLLIEAYHIENDDDEFNQGDTNNLIASSIIEHSIIPKDDFIEPVTSIVPGRRTQAPSMTWNAKLKCVNDNYGDQCQRSCTARDDRFGHYTCDSDGYKICMKGWTGPKSFQACTTVACPDGCVKENAFCETPGVCKCRSGWMGANCDTCVRTPGCLKGSCQQPDQCTCDDGWTGRLCDIDQNFCTTTQPCGIGGTCISGVEVNRNYSCICQLGYKGSDCEIWDRCAVDPCMNQGSCQEKGSGYDCICTEQFEGKNCEKPKCLCENGGTCAVNSSICICPLAYTGDKCELIVPETTTTTSSQSHETTAKQRTTTSTETTKKICAPDPNNSSNIICGCEGSIECPGKGGIKKGKCYNDTDCAPYGSCHKFKNTCKCDSNHSGDFCQTLLNLGETRQKHGSVLSPGQMVVLGVVITIIVVAFIVTALVVHQRKRDDAGMIESSKEENLALANNDPESVAFKSRTTSTAATSRA